MLEVNTLPRLWQALSFLSHGGCVYKRARLKDEGQFCSLWKTESTGSSQKQAYLLPIDFLPDPCTLQSIHQVTLPSYST